MLLLRTLATGMSTTHVRPLRLPAAAQRLRLPVWQRSQARMRERYGFDLSTSDMLERVRSLVAEQPTDAERVLLLAAALTMSGDRDLAEQQARRAVEIAPEMARAHTTLAALLITAEDRAPALEHARRAGELDSADPSVLYNLGLAEWFAGDRHKAKDAFARTGELLSREQHPGATARGRGWWPLRRRG